MLPCLFIYSFGLQGYVIFYIFQSEHFLYTFGNPKNPHTHTNKTKCQPSGPANL